MAVRKQRTGAESVQMAVTIMTSSPFHSTHYVVLDFINPPTLQYRLVAQYISITRDSKISNWLHSSVQKNREIYTIAVSYAFQLGELNVSGTRFPPTSSGLATEVVETSAAVSQTW